MFHVRLLFNGTATDFAHICAGPPPAVSASRGGDVVLYAAFCQNDESLSFLRAAGDGFSGPTDPEFKDFMQQVTMTLFPPQNNELLRNGNDCRSWSC
jgi:ABC-type nitrate/sulfonate/bicarbonate transport system substrate-binding protein